jgi:asparagine synthase (glutamine-hydrolysing)
MCGIFGYFPLKRLVEVSRCLEKLDLLAHRGPDGWGVAHDEIGTGNIRIHYNSAPQGDKCTLFLGHHRLSIVDLTDTSIQPMQDPATEAILLFNGEIYNHSQLRRELESIGHSFRTLHSDTEVLLKAYSEWGSECLRRLNGMFAFALYEPKHRRVFLARDRLGQKPLFYRHDAKGLEFASELTPLIGRHSVLDPLALGQYLTLAYVPAPRSIIAGVQKLLPGHFGVYDLDTGQMDFQRYWDVDIEAPMLDGELDSDLIEDVGRALQKSVRYRSKAEVGICMLLSGGIDSTCIAKMAVAAGVHMRAYTASFKDPRFNELVYARSASGRYALPLHSCKMEEPAPVGLNRIIDCFDEPFGGLSSVSLSFLLGAAKREGSKVVLTGDGGDELFFGYEKYNGLGRFSNANDPWRAYLASHSDLVLLGLMKEKPGIDAVLSYAAPYIRSGAPAARTAQYLDLKTSLPGRILTKLDRISMSFGMEGRSPFMDHGLVELAYRLPRSESGGDDPCKFVLKKLIEEDLGSSFVHRPKLGFGHPLRSWFSGTQRRGFLASLLDPQSMLYQWLDYSKVHGLFPGMTGDSPPKSVRKIWRLLVLGRFLERHQLNR